MINYCTIVYLSISPPGQKCIKLLNYRVFLHHRRGNIKVNRNSLTEVFKEAGLVPFNHKNFADGTYISANFSGFVLVVTPKRLKLRGASEKQTFFNFSFRKYAPEQRVPTQTLFEFGNLAPTTKPETLKHWAEELVKILRLRKKCRLCGNRPYLIPVILENRKLGSLRCSARRHWATLFT